MPDNFAIRVENLSKKFSRSLKRAMVYGLVDITRAALIPHRYRSEGLEARQADAQRQGTALQGGVSARHREAETNGHAPDASNPGAQGLRPAEFWALRDVSFELAPGECMGVVGHNGAGKSTLMSVLSGIYGPTRGRVEVRGRLQALIALGAGFHPALSGRENIYINAAVLGMSTRKVDLVFEEIVDFAELLDFIDMPVKNYSSGMLVRLGFAVAAHIEPDVLLVDEVLSVGDLAFQNKSFKKMRGLIDTGVPMLFVSHYPQAVEMVCNRAMWLDHGSVMQCGEMRDVVDAYVDHMNKLRAQQDKQALGQSSELFPIRITEVETFDGDGHACREFRHDATIIVRMHYECTSSVDHPYFAVGLRRSGGDHNDFAICSMAQDNIDRAFSPGKGYVDCELRNMRLCPGGFAVRCLIARARTRSAGQSIYQDWFTATHFFIKGTPEEIGRPGMLRSTMWHVAPVLVDHQWSPPVSSP